MGPKHSWLTLGYLGEGRFPRIPTVSFRCIKNLIRPNMYIWFSFRLCQAFVLTSSKWLFRRASCYHETASLYRNHLILEVSDSCFRSSQIVSEPHCHGTRHSKSQTEHSFICKSRSAFFSVRTFWLFFPLFKSLSSLILFIDSFVQNFWLILDRALYQYQSFNAFTVAEAWQDLYKLSCFLPSLEPHYPLLQLNRTSN